MSESNKTYRIRTKVGKENTDKYINVMLDQDYENFEILSLNISRENAYKLHTSNYGCIAGRVLANGAYGIPNAKISVFIPTKESEDIDPVLAALYPYETTLDKNIDGIRYNTLPDEKIEDCHQAVGTFPNKRLVLDDNNVLEIYDKYYKYNAVSNEAGDYMIFGVPTGEQIIHVDVDLSDIGDLSQTPRDMIFKGYDINQFESPSMFKSSTELDTLTQIISQNSSVYVNPFWGDSESSNISITRNDIEIKYKFEPTCVFIGSLVTDGGNNGISQNCIPSKDMGSMDQLKGGSGTIEMIRKTPENNVESFVIHGTKLIDGNGTWCYQIPMNLDYMGTDEYGNTVATNDPNKGIPTRTRVRFRVSLTDSSSEYVNNHLAKVLIPNNPSSQSDLDYVFGTYSKDDDGATKSFRDLFANNVYTVKSYIPRIQKSNAQRNEHFSGIKNINVTNGNNPIPYNNMRVNMSFMFILQCALLKIIIRIIRVVNKLRRVLGRKTCIVMGDGVCPDLEGWYFAPGCNDNMLRNTLNNVDGDSEEGSSPKSEVDDAKSVDAQNSDNSSMCITRNIDYLMQCVEINLAMEYNVIKFDFYNDWINGMIYIPHWYGNIRRKRTYIFGLIKLPEKVQACMEDTFFKSRKFVQQCSLSYGRDSNTQLYTKIASNLGCKDNKKQKCHKVYGRNYRQIMGRTGGLVHNELTLKQEHVYYFRPCEWLDTDKRYPTKCNLFATDIVMLGSLSEYNKDGIPTAFNDLSGSSFKLPGNLVRTNLETDGPLYTMTNGSLCMSSQPVLEDAVSTTTYYNQYSRGTSEWTDESDDDEYKLSEMSGIDWGFSGPGQGKNILKDLYFPGGHFLGISCFNTETNIKSCVNLTRACEVGVNLSQYQDIVSEISQNDKNEVEFKYLRRIPNGLISKEEINDSNFRNIFATLNFNGLRTKIDPETNYRRYDLISNMSFNFDGTLSEIVNETNESYNRVETGIKFQDTPNTDVSENEKMYHSSVEKTDKNYYCFRLGLPNSDVNKSGDYEQFVKSKYLNNKDVTVSIPMYNNSLYFYFGIKDGQTAYDRFLEEFYAVCPDEELTTPAIEITDTTEADLCNVSNGSATFSIEGLTSAYTIKLEMFINEKWQIKKLTEFQYENNKAYINTNGTLQELPSEYSEFIIKGLHEGEYRLLIMTINDNSQYVKEFSIGTSQPDFLEDIINSVTVVDFNQEYIGGERNPYNTVYDGFIKFTKSTKYKNYLSEIIMEHGGEVVCKFDVVNNTATGGYVTVNNDEVNMYVPSGNSSYTISYLVLCSEEGEDRIYNNGDNYYITMPSEFDYYFGRPDSNGIAVRNCLHVNKLENTWYKDEKLSGLTPYQLWLLEKTLIYNKSMFTLSESDHSIPLGLIGGIEPYNEVIYGHGEKIVNDKYSLKTYTGPDDSYNVDYDSFMFPTHIDVSDDKGAVFGEHIKKLKDLSIVDKSEGCTNLHNYNLDLSDSTE